MSPILIAAVVIIYLLITAFFGYLGYRQTKTASDYLLAGRKAHPVIMAISYGATFISTSAIIGFGGAAGVFGMGLLWLTVLNIIVGIFIAFVLFGKRTRKMGHNLDAHTFPELIGKRYNSPFLRSASSLVIFLAMPLYAGAVIIGGAQFIAQTLAIPYEVALLFFVAVVAVYVVMGGMKGVMYTDAFQGAIMFVGMAILLIFTYVLLGGITESHQALTNLTAQVPEAMKQKGHLGWTSMPAGGSILWWQLVSTIVMGVGIGVLAQPQLIVRFMTVKSDRELNRGVLIGGIFILMMTGVAFIVGSLSNVYFFNNPAFGKIAIAAAGGKVDNIIPLYINSAMPAWFTAIFMITLLAAAMSTLSSQFHTMGTALGRDFLEAGLKKQVKNPMVTTKLAMMVGILLATFLAYVLPKFFEQGSAIIAIGTAIFFGLCAASFLPLYFSALYFRKISKTAAIAGFLSGLTTSAFWLVFVHVKESAPLGICKALTGSPSLAGNSILSQVDPIIIGLPVAIIVTLVTALFTRGKPDQYVEKAFEGIK